MDKRFMPDSENTLAGGADDQQSLAQILGSQEVAEAISDMQGQPQVPLSQPQVPLRLGEDPNDSQPNVLDAEHPTRTSQPALETQTTTQVLVAPGDSLWTIAQRHLGPDATPQQVANEVERIFELNRDQIGDDPDQIFPGQELSLAPVRTPSEIVMPEAEPTAVALGQESAAEEHQNDATGSGFEFTHDSDWRGDIEQLSAWCSQMAPEGEEVDDTVDDAYSDA